MEHRVRNSLDSDCISELLERIGKLLITMEQHKVANKKTIMMQPRDRKSSLIKCLCSYNHYYSLCYA